MIYYLLLSISILFIILCIIRIHPNSSIKQIIKSNIRMSILTDVILDMVKNDLSTAIKWETAEITPNDMKFLKEDQLFLIKTDLTTTKNLMSLKKKQNLYKRNLNQAENLYMIVNY